MDDRWYELQEQPFHSDVPLIGRFIVWFRALWNNVATRWYVLPMIQQQTNINHRLNDEIILLRNEVAMLREEISAEQEIRFDLDKELVTTRRDQAAALYALQTDVKHLRARLEKAEG